MAYYAGYEKLALIIAVSFLDFRFFSDSASVDFQLAAEVGSVRDTEQRTGVYTPVHEDSSTVSTKQFASAGDFGKKSSNELDLR